MLHSFINMFIAAITVYINVINLRLNDISVQLKLIGTDIFTNIIDIICIRSAWQ